MNWKAAGVDLPEIETEEVTATDVPWNVIVSDDPVNLMPYVTMVIQKVFGYSESKAATLMLEIHKQGKSVVWSGEREKAEHYVQQLHQYQLLAIMKKAA